MPLTSQLRRAGDAGHAAADHDNLAHSASRSDTAVAPSNRRAPASVGPRSSVPPRRLCPCMAGATHRPIRVNRPASSAGRSRGDLNGNPPSMRRMRGPRAKKGRIPGDTCGEAAADAVWCAADGLHSHGMSVTVRPGSPYPLGVHFTDGGANVAVYSSVADEVLLCLFDAQGAETPVVAARNGRRGLARFRRGDRTRPGVRVPGSGPVSIRRRVNGAIRRSCCSIPTPERSPATVDFGPAVFGSRRRQARPAQRSGFRCGGAARRDGGTVTGRRSRFAGRCRPSARPGSASGRHRCSTRST